HKAKDAKAALTSALQALAAAQAARNLALADGDSAVEENAEGTVLAAQHLCAALLDRARDFARAVPHAVALWRTALRRAKAGDGEPAASTARGLAEVLAHLIRLLALGQPPAHQAALQRVGQAASPATLAASTAPVVHAVLEAVLAGDGPVPAITSIMRRVVGGDEPHCSPTVLRALADGDGHTLPPDLLMRVTGAHSGSPHVDLQWGVLHSLMHLGSPLASQLVARVLGQFPKPALSEEHRPMGGAMHPGAAAWP
ncbi:unnamed protein product, partial [Symbiodinium sp. KB8]